MSSLLSILKLDNPEDLEASSSTRKRSSYNLFGDDEDDESPPPKHPALDGLFGTTNEAPMDTNDLMTKVTAEMRKHKISQCTLSRCLGIKQMWLSRMIRAPFPWDRMHENVQESCWKLLHWLELPQEARLEIVNEKDKEVPEVDDTKIDVPQMLQEIRQEMEQHEIFLSDFSKAADVKYSWIYSTMKQPIAFENLNSKGKDQCRRLFSWLQLPIEQRFPSLIPGDASNELNTLEIAKRVNKEIKDHGLSIRGIAKILQMDNGRLCVILKTPPRWRQLHPDGRKTFRKLLNWLELPEEQRLAELSKKTVPFEIDTIEITKRVSEHIEKKGISISALAKEVNMHTGTLSNMLRAPLPFSRIRAGGCSNYKILLDWLQEQGDAPDDFKKAGEEPPTAGQSEEQSAPNPNVPMVFDSSFVKREPVDEFPSIPSTPSNDMSILLPITQEVDGSNLTLMIPFCTREDMAKISSFLIMRGFSFEIVQPHIKISVFCGDVINLIDSLREQGIRNPVQSPAKQYHH